MTSMSRTARAEASRIWLRLFQSLALLGVLAPTVYFAIDGAPVGVVLFLLMLTMLGFIGAVLWLLCVDTWHMISPLALALMLFPLALFSVAGIGAKFELDAIRDKVLMQLGAKTEFRVRRSSYSLPGFDPSGFWEIELLKPLPAPRLHLVPPDINFSVRDATDAWYGPAAIAKRLVSAPSITDTHRFRVYAADTHYSDLCDAPGHCSIELTFSPDSKVLLLDVGNF